MCSGGGGRATIVTPDTRAYDNQAQLQLDAMKSVMDGQTKLQQQQLNAAMDQKNEMTARMKELRVEQANNTAAQVARMTALIGTPPPEKTAKAPVVGRNRGAGSTKGKGALRIERSVASSAGQGAGLNIT